MTATYTRATTSVRISTDDQPEVSFTRRTDGAYSFTRRTDGAYLAIIQLGMDSRFATTDAAWCRKAATVFTEAAERLEQPACEQCGKAASEEPAS